jgi:type I restriction enzyme S subunit
MTALYGQGVTDALGKQTTGIANLDVPAFMAMEVRVPDAASKRSIADYLDAESAKIVALVDGRRRQELLLAERMNSTIHALVTQGLRRSELVQSGLGWAEMMPRHWGLPPVGALFEVQLGKMVNPDATQSDDKYPYLRNVNVQWDRIDLGDLNEMHFDGSDRLRYALKPGDLLVCEGGEVGRAAVWSGGPATCYYQKALHRLRPLHDASARFLMYALWAASNRGVFENEGNTSTIVHLTAEKLRAHRFPWPPRAEQDEIVRELDCARAEVARLRDHLSRQIDLLLDRRQALITAAVTGQLEIPGVAA